MNEELKNLANETLTSLIQQVSEAGEFIKGEIPIVVEELLKWKFWENVAVFGLTATLFVVYLIIMKKTWKMIPKSDEYGNILGRDDDGMFCFLIFGVLIFGGICSALLFVVGFPSAFEALQIGIAPRVYLLEYAANLAG